jgi:hypothetical protein
MKKKPKSGRNGAFPSVYSKPAPFGDSKKRGDKTAVAGLGVEKRGYGR